MNSSISELTQSFCSHQLRPSSNIAHLPTNAFKAMPFVDIFQRVNRSVQPNDIAANIHLAPQINIFDEHQSHNSDDDVLLGSAAIIRDDDGNFFINSNDAMPQYSAFDKKKSRLRQHKSRRNSSKHRTAHRLRTDAQRKRNKRQQQKETLTMHQLQEIRNIANQQVRKSRKKRKKALFILENGLEDYDPSRVDTIDLGPKNVICPHCSAELWQVEVVFVDFQPLPD